MNMNVLHLSALLTLVVVFPVAVSQRFGLDASRTSAVTKTSGRDNEGTRTVSKLQQSSVPLKILALGDSYMTGNGARSLTGARYQPPYGYYGCRRSNLNYAYRYAQEMAKEGFAVTYLNRACAGAFVSDITSPRALGSAGPFCPRNSLAPDVYYERTGLLTCPRYAQAQIDHVDETVDLLLLSLGGNDNDAVATIVMSCLSYPGLTNYENCKASREHVFATSHTLQGKLVDVLSSIYQKMKGNNAEPKGKVVYVSYPYQVLENGGRILEGPNGETLDAGQVLRDYIDEVELIQRNATIEVNSQIGSEFVIFYDKSTELFAGHEADPRLFRSNRDGWIHEAERIRVFDAFHPNTKGWEGWAEGIIKEGTFGVQGGASLGGTSYLYDAESVESNEPPFAWLDEVYSAQVGHPVVLSAQGSYDPYGLELTIFEWDVDGDGKFDQTTYSEPSLTTRYNRPFEGTASVRIQASDGRSAVASAYVEVVL